eukprot:6904273-Pyramimonas_sp.AAC.1
MSRTPRPSQSVSERSECSGTLWNGFILVLPSPVRSIRSPLPPPNETNLPPGARGHPAQREQWRRARRPGTGARGDGRGRRGCLEEGRGE